MKYIITMWTRPKDINYDNRLAILSRIKKYVNANLEFGVPLAFPKPIPYSYNGGIVRMVNIERHKYMSVFKREFKTIRCLLDNGSYARLIDLRMKHLVEIYQQLRK